MRWLEAVEAFTSFHRRARAGRLLYRGARPMAGGDVALSAWHADRIKGQAERFQRVAECGGETGLYWKSDAGHEFPMLKRCDQWRVCPRCRKARQNKLKKGVIGQRATAMTVYRRERAKHYGGREGRWSEKLLTLTVPHSEKGPAEDAQILPKAWAEFSRAMARHLTRRGMRKGLSQVWVRALEIAPGGTGGHAHLHVWMLGPYIERALIHTWWGNALGVLGRSVPRRSLESVLEHCRDSRSERWLGRYRSSGVPWPVVDFGQTRNGEDAAAYAAKVGVIGYITKGSKGEVAALAPVHAAAIYEAMEGVRCVQWARGWAPKKDGSPHSWRLVRVDAGRCSDESQSECVERVAWQTKLARWVAEKSAKNQPDDSAVKRERI